MRSREKGLRREAMTITHLIAIVQYQHNEHRTVSTIKIWFTFNFFPKAALLACFSFLLPFHTRVCKPLFGHRMAFFITNMWGEQRRYTESADLVTTFSLFCPLRRAASEIQLRRRRSISFMWSNEGSACKGQRRTSTYLAKCGQKNDWSPWKGSCTCCTLSISLAKYVTMRKRFLSCRHDRSDGEIAFGIDETGRHSLRVIKNQINQIETDKRAIFAAMKPENSFPPEKDVYLRGKCQKTSTQSSELNHHGHNTSSLSDTFGVSHQKLCGLRELLKHQNFLELSGIFLF